MNQFYPIVVFHIETSHLICSANQMTFFYMKCNTGMKWVKRKCWKYLCFIPKKDKYIRTYFIRIMAQHLLLLLICISPKHWNYFKWTFMLDCLTHNLIRSCYRTVLSATWKIFSECLVFCNLFFEPLGRWNNGKARETRKIFVNIERNNCSIVKILLKSNITIVFLLTASSLFKTQNYRTILTSQ